MIFDTALDEEAVIQQFLENEKNERMNKESIKSQEE